MRQILDNLGFSTKYKGYTMLLEAIEMATEDEEKASKLSRFIYPEVAKRHDMSPSGVEKSIQRVIRSFWENGNRSFYCKIAGYEVTKRPANAAFINTVASYIIRSRVNQQQ